jgi:diaminohydroxyphosphoribosylaminopyrimidine deaminase/5-amino-6-(5-phosphoribosylamino)uracil reductase
MKKVLTEAAKGLGLTSPNPPVGAILVRDGEVIGVGYHHKAGEPHAEIEALLDAMKRRGPKAKSAKKKAAGHSLENSVSHSDLTKGATLYVTLEPCSTAGKTGACTDAILKAGISRVVVGCEDPNPAHAGQGLTILRKAGIEVRCGVMRNECADLIRFFAKHITTAKPWVIAKTAITLDGHTTLPKERGQWISSEKSLEDVQRIRAVCDAILIGGETLRRDNPQLTLRGKFAERDRPQPWRVVLSAEPELPKDSLVFTDDHKDRTIVYQGKTLGQALDDLGKRGIQSVMLESGGRLFAYGIAKGLIDELVLYVAPIIGGGSNRLLPVDGIVADLKDMRSKRIGPDIKITGRFS